MRLSEPEAGPEGKEGLGEIFGRICLFNYGLLSKSLGVGQEKEGTLMTIPTGLATH